MDVFSHGLWGGVTAGRRSRKSFWLALLIGMAPDILSFGVFWVDVTFGIHTRPDWSHVRPMMHDIPQYVSSLYNITHSFVVFLLVFSAVWLIRKKPTWEMGAWAMHILIDIPSHSAAFFPTPFLWPVSKFVVNGISWGQPIVMLPNIISLAVLYGAWLFVYRKGKLLKSNKV